MIVSLANIDEGNGTGKDKYISFQLQWHEYCSILLLPKHLPIQCVISPPTITMETTCQLWLDLCSTSRNDEEKRKKFMILFSSAIWCAVVWSRQAIEQNYCRHSRDCNKEYTCNSWRRWCLFSVRGGTLASMLHCRYDIRKCGDERREIIWLEKAVLQAINTRVIYATLP